MKNYTEQDMLKFALFAKDKMLYNQNAVKNWYKEQEAYDTPMYGSEYNLVVEGDLNTTVGFGCIADLLACAHILACLPNCNDDFFTVSKYGYLGTVSTSPVRRALNGISWPAVEKRLDEYLEKTDAQEWVIERKNTFMIMLHDVLKWQSSNAEISVVLSKEKLGQMMTGRK